MSNDEFGTDGIRRRLSERENHLVDEVRSGGLSRRNFLRAATVAGMSLPLASMLSGGPVQAATKKATTKPAAKKPAKKAAE